VTFTTEPGQRYTAFLNALADRKATFLLTLILMASPVAERANPNRPFPHPKDTDPSQSKHPRTARRIIAYYEP
jgi:hypothetical protein